MKQGCEGCRVRSEFKNRTEQAFTSLCDMDPKMMKILKQYGIYTLGELGLVKITLHLLPPGPNVCQMRSRLSMGAVLLCCSHAPAPPALGRTC